MELELPNLIVIHNFYLFYLRGVDVVLGYVWLEGLGKLKDDFKEHVIWMTMDDNRVEIRDDPQLSRTIAPLKMYKEL